MAIRKIAQMGEPVLRRVARPLSVEELKSPAIQTLIDDMIDTMHDADGVGLAAPQVYESIQVCVIEISKNPRYPDALDIPLTVLVNPVVTPQVESSLDDLAEADSIAMFEGCLSVTGLRGQVVRPRRVRVQALDRQGKALDFVWEGVRASVVQHETDHLKGVLYVDLADSTTLSFLREYERYVPRGERIVDRGAT
ncbi:MAG TPA: peptide deformylase [Polyangiaceae bacterium]|nr:peptide deformylase [Polyangiaceae bacterium]